MVLEKYYFIPAKLAFYDFGIYIEKTKEIGGNFLFFFFFLQHAASKKVSKDIKIQFKIALLNCVLHVDRKLTHPF